MLRVRSHARVLETFSPESLAMRTRETVWDINDLLTSFDAKLKEINRMLKDLHQKTFFRLYPEISTKIIEAIQLLSMWQADLKKINFYYTTILYIYADRALELMKMTRASKKKVVSMKKHVKEKEEAKHLRSILRDLDTMDDDAVALRQEYIEALHAAKDKANKKARDGFSFAGFFARYVREEYFMREIRISTRKLKEIELRERPMLATLDIVAHPDNAEELMNMHRHAIIYITKALVMDRLSYTKFKQRENVLKKLTDRFRNRLPKQHDNEERQASYAVYMTRAIDKAFVAVDEVVKKSLKDMAGHHLMRLNDVA